MYTYAKLGGVGDLSDGLEDLPEERLLSVPLNPIISGDSERLSLL